MACFLQRRGDWNLHLQVTRKKEERKDKAFSPPSSLKQKTFSKQRRPEAIKRTKNNPAEKHLLRYLEEYAYSSPLFPAPLCVSFLFFQRGREKNKRIRENSNAHIKWEPERRIETRSRNCQKSKLRNTRFIQYS